MRIISGNGTEETKASYFAANAVREFQLLGARIDGNQLMAEFQIGHRNELSQIGNEAVVGGIPEMRDVMSVGRRDEIAPLSTSSKIRPVDPWPQPIRAHVLRGREMVLSRVRHRKGLGERPAKTREQPVLVVVDRPLGSVANLHEVGDHLDHQVFRQTVKVNLDWMGGPITRPIVVQIDLNALILLIDALGEKFLNARIFGKGNVRAEVEDEAAIVTEGGRVTAMVSVLVDIALASCPRRGAGERRQTRPFLFRGLQSLALKDFLLILWFYFSRGSKQPNAFAGKLPPRKSHIVTL